MTFSAAQMTAFFTELSASTSIWTIEDADGIPAPKTTKGARSMPFWSKQSRAQRMIETIPVYAGFTPAETRAALKRKLEPSYMGTFTGARRYVLHTFANTQSALMRKRVSRFMEGKPCPICHGKRLKPEALSVTFAGVDIGEFMQMPLDQLAALLEPIAQGDFRAHTAGEGTDKEATRRDRAERAASGQAVHAVSPDVRRTSALSEEKRLAAQRRHIAACDADAARRGAAQAHDGTDGRGLAGARFAHDGVRAAPAHAQRHAVHGAEQAPRMARRGEFVHQILHLDGPVVRRSLLCRGRAARRGR